MMDLNQILNRLRQELEKCQSIQTVLGRSFERPLKSISDGYPEIAVSWIKTSLNKILLFLIQQNKIVFESDEPVTKINELLEISNEGLHPSIILIGEINAK